MESVRGTGEPEWMHSESARTDRSVESRRVRWRLSLRAAIGLVLVVGVGLGWITHRVDLQRRAVEAVEATGGKVYYDWEASAARAMFWKSPPPRPLPAWRRWLIERLGPDWVGHVSAVFLGPERTDEVMALVGRLGGVELLSDGPRTTMTDEGFAHVRDLSTLRYLMAFGPIRGEALANVEGLGRLQHFLLDGANLGDDDLAHLEGLVSLETLMLPGRRIGGAGLSHLGGLSRLKTLSLGDKSRVSDLAPIRGLTRLEFLGLSNSLIDDAGLAPVANFRSLHTLLLNHTPITDAGLGFLRGLRSLTRLELSGTRITDAGLANLAGLTGISSLDLDGTGVGDDGLVHLRGMTKLRILHLNRTRITDAGLAQLAALRSLKVLGLSGTAITDAGLTRLSGMSSLAIVSVRGTAVTAAGAAAFEKANPRVRVLR